MLKSIVFVRYVIFGRLQKMKVKSAMISARIKYNAWDYVFLFWFLTNVLFNHSLIGTVGQAFFMLYSVCKCLISRNLATTKVVFFYLIFVFICYLNISLGNSVVPKESKFLLKVLLRNGIFLYCMFAYVRQLNHIKLSKVFILACVLGSMFMLVYNRILTGAFVIRDAEDGLNGNMIATMDAMAICVIFAMDKWKSIKNIVIIALLILFCILAGTRKAFIVLILGISIYILLSQPSKLFSSLSKLAILLCFVYIILLEVPFFYEIIGNRFESLFSFTQGGDTDASTDSRSHYIELGFYYFLMEPWTGNGISCFKEMPGVSTYSHNNYIELLFSVGIPGIISFYLIHLYILSQAIKNCRATANKGAILSIALIFSVIVAEYAMVTYHERAALFYYMMILRFGMVSDRPKVSYTLRNT